jgi:hypothetical protein
MAVGAQQPLTAERFGIGIPFRYHLRPQVQGSFGRPGVQGGVRQPAPPGLIDKPQDPVGMLGRQLHQPVAALFLRMYCGSGLVIHRLARRQLTPSRLRAWRMVSMLTR